MPENYTYARLVGASIRITWIGPREIESGIMVGSHVFNATPLTLTQDIIEEGYFPVRAAPHEGLRFVYVPRDDQDLQFTALDKKVAYGGTNVSEGLPLNATNYFLATGNDPE